MQPRVEKLLRDEPGELIIPAPITAEVDYLLGRRLGRRARIAFLDDLAAGRFTVAGLDAQVSRSSLISSGGTTTSMPGWPTSARS
jgi:hypothetical protein